MRAQATADFITLEDRYVGALMGLAVGDVLGAAVEFRERDSFQLTDMPTENSGEVIAGYFTDDTSMALCLAESLIENKGYRPLDQLYRYLKWFQEGYLSPYGIPFGIGNTTHDAIQRFVENPQEPYCGSDDPDTAGNGSLMRLAPVPMFFRNDIKKAAHYSGESSRTTHQAREAVEACQIFGRMIVLALNGKDKDEILAANDNVNDLSDNIRAIALGSYKTMRREDIQSSGYVVHSLEAALWAFYHSNNFREGALLAVNLGEDTDTIAAIYGQLAGAHYGAEKIPAHWREFIAMRDVIEDKARQLLRVSELVPKPKK